VLYEVKSGVRAAVAAPPRASPTYSEVVKAQVLGDASRRRRVASVRECPLSHSGAVGRLSASRFGGFETSLIVAPSYLIPPGGFLAGTLHVDVAADTT
jgi:hypothetical protein